MYFKISKTYLLVFLLPAVLSCGRFLQKSEKPADDTVHIHKTEFQCLSELPQNLKNYFDDRLSEVETAAIFDCVDSLVTEFAKISKGENPNQYSIFEMKFFLQKYLNDVSIPDPLLNEVYKFKAFLFGGDSQNFTKDQINRLKNLLAILKQQALLLRGNWQVLLFQAESTDTTQLSLLYAKVNSLTMGISDNAIDSSIDYSWQDFKSLLLEVKAFKPGKDLFDKLDKWLPLAESIKNLFLGKSADLKTKSDWKYLLRWLAEGYSAVASYYYQNVKLDLAKQDGWRETAALIEKGLNLVLTSPEMMKKKKLLTVNVDTVLDELNKQKIVSLPISFELLKQSYKKIFIALFSDKKNGAQGWDVMPFISDQQVMSLQNEYLIWQEEQLKLVNLYNLIAPSYREVADEFSNPKFSEWRGVLLNPFTMIMQDNLSFLIPAEKERRVSYKSMTVLHAVRTLARLIQKGYGDGEDVWAAKLSKEKLTQAVSDFRDLGVELKFFDHRESDAAETFYRDARFFTYSSEGNEKIDSEQIVELVSLMISGGKGSAVKIMQQAVDGGCATGFLDDGFGQPILQQQCFVELFQNKYSDWFSNLQSLVPLFQQGKLQVLPVLQDLITIVERKGKLPGTIQFSEIRQLSAVLNYIESLVLRYDANHDQLLTEQEVVQSFPRFKAVIDQITHGFMSENAFLFVVYNGRKPGLPELAQFIEKRVKGQLGTVDRSNLFKVVILLKQPVQ